MILPIGFFGTWMLRIVIGSYGNDSPTSFADGEKFWLVVHCRVEFRFIEMEFCVHTWRRTRSTKLALMDEIKTYFFSEAEAFIVLGGHLTFCPYMSDSYITHWHSKWTVDGCELDQEKATGNRTYVLCLAEALSISTCRSRKPLPGLLLTRTSTPRMWLSALLVRIVPSQVLG
jgi:hypothetical protein